MTRDSRPAPAIPRRRRSVASKPTPCRRKPRSFRTQFDIPHHPVILALETSQRAGSVALLASDGRVSVETLPLERGTDALAPAIDRCVRGASLEPRDLDAVGVSIGPGGFTGLRIAVTTAKMLAFSLDVTVVPVPSAFVAAESLDEDVLPADRVLVALACKRETFWATRLTRDDGTWRESGTAALVDATSATLDSIGAVVADRFLPDSMRARCVEAGIPVVEPRFDARACLRLTQRRLEHNRTVDALALAPIYPRPPEAVSLWDARAAQRPR